MISPLQILIADVDGVNLTQIGPAIQHLRYSHQAPGGNLDLTFQWPASLTAIPDYFNAAYDVLVKGGGANIWRGYMDKVRFVQRGNEQYFDVHAIGYGAHLSDGLDTTENVQNTATNTIMANAVTNHAPKITAQSIVATSVTLSNATAITLIDMRPSEIINWAARFGNSVDVDVIYEVYPDATESATVTITLKARPTTPDYYVNLKDIEAEWGFDFSYYANRVIVRYNDGASTVTVEDTTAQGAGPSGVNRIKVHYLDVPQVTQAADATQIGDVELAKRKTLRMALESIVMGGDTLVLDSTFEDVPLYQVRAGKMLQIQGVAAAGDQGALVWNNFCHIARAEWDDDRQTLTLTPEGFEESFDFVVAQAALGAKGAA